MRSARNEQTKHERVMRLPNAKTDFEGQTAPAASQSKNNETKENNRLQRLTQNGTKIMKGEQEN